MNYGIRHFPVTETLILLKTRITNKIFDIISQNHYGIDIRFSELTSEDGVSTIWNVYQSLRNRNCLYTGNEDFKKYVKETKYWNSSNQKMQRCRVQLFSIVQKVLPKSKVRFRVQLLNLFRKFKSRAAANVHRANS